MLLNYFLTNPRMIFLVDSIGALLSALLLLVVAYFDELLGMPKETLRQLVALPVLFMAYSAGCFLFKPNPWKRYLGFIATANIFYCVLTIALLFYFANRLTTFGFAYFSLEIIVVLLLAVFELKLVLKR